LTIPADSFLFSKEYIGYTKYLEMSTALKEYSKSKKQLPESFEQAYIQTNPNLYLVYSHLGDYYYEIEDYTRAYSYYQTALSKEVAGMDLRNDLLKLSEETLKKSRHAHTEN
jgi:tetratricopeptide (TPR) repeat protein